jgi:hypothetical protein
MDNGYLIAFVVVAAFSIGVLRYRNRESLQQGYRAERFQRPRAEPERDREDTRAAHTRMDSDAWEPVSLEPDPMHGQHSRLDADPGIPSEDKAK